MASTSCRSWFAAGPISAGVSATTPPGPRSGPASSPARRPRRRSSGRPSRSRCRRSRSTRARMPDAPGLELIAQGIEEGREGTVVETAFEHGKATLIISPGGVLHALRWLRDEPEQRYTFLSSLHAADYLPATPRFAVHYELLSRERVERLNVKALLEDPAAGNGHAIGEEPLPELDSCVELYPTAEYQEREAYDFF